MTLIELLIATTMSLVVMGAAMGFLATGQRSAQQTGSRAETLGAQRVVLERMTRDMRQAQTVNVVSPSIVDLQIPAPGTTLLRPVRYDCSQASSCRRQQGVPGGALSANAATILTGVQSATFSTSSVAASQDYIQVELVVRTPGRTQGAALSAGVFVRNKAG
ncbi:MAG: hypothetical protein QOG62_126 [Thermoleophilaceae bacterium]|nr:hypothetical protein [Thermoleophilaceae bacterium]